MKKEIKISVIIPAYNIEQYIGSCLDSVINQSLKEIEIICVDGGSADKTLDIIEEYAAKDGRVKIINQKSKGLPGARNEGLDIAVGEYIYFLDGDDALNDNGALAGLFDFAARGHADIVFFDGEVSYVDDEAYASRRHITENYYIRKNDYSKVTTGPELFAAMMENDEYRCMSCMYLTRAEHITAHKLRFAEGILHEDDLYTYICLMQAGKAAHIGKTFYLRRVRAGSLLTGGRGFHEFYSYLVDHIGIRKFAKKAGLSDNVQKQTERFLEGIQNALIAMYNTARGEDDWLGRLGPGKRRAAKQVLGIDNDYGAKAFIAGHLPALLLAAIILFVSVYMIYWTGQKREFHQDEMFSLMNIRGGDLDRPYYYDGFFNTWHTGAELESMIGVSRGNEFSAVFSSDSLYWSLLHIAYSFTPGSFSIWPSVILNMLALAGSLAVIYLLGRFFIENKYLALLPVLLWGISSAAVNLVLFIRFYCFKTFICLLLLYVVLLAIKNGFDRWIYPAAIAALMCIGVFIHQYFLVFAFFLAAAVCIYLLLMRKIKPLLIFAGLMAAGVAVFELFTRSISGLLSVDGSNITEGNRIEEAADSLLRGGEGYAERINNYLSVISDAIFAGISPLVILMLFGLLAAIVVVCAKDRALLKEQAARFWLLTGGVCAGYVLMIARIAPYQEFRYISCVSPLIMILFISLLIKAMEITGIRRVIPVSAMIAAPCSVLLILNISSIIPNVELGRYNDKIDDYRHLPVLCVSNEDWEVSRCYRQLLDFEDEILITTTDNIDFKAIGRKQYNEGILLMLLDVRGGCTPEDIASAAGLGSSTYITTLMRHNVFLLQ